MNSFLSPPHLTKTGTSKIPWGLNRWLRRGQLENKIFEMRLLSILEKANTPLPRGCTGHSKHPLPTTQEKTLHMDITRWSIAKSDWLYSLQSKMEKLYTVSKNKTRSLLWLRSWTPFAKFRLKLKKVRKTSRPFKYNLNQIPYDYTVEVANRFKRLDLIDRVPEELWTEDHNIVHKFVIKTIPKKCKRQNRCLRRPYK